MPLIDRSALVPHSPAEMFAVVNDVAAYPGFLPSCSAATVITESPGAMTARLELSRAGFRQSFTTHNELHPPHRIDLALVDGPFRSFAGSWHFDALGEMGCKVSFRLVFELDSRLMAVAAGKLFEMVADHMVDVFCERAEVLYG